VLQFLHKLKKRKEGRKEGRKEEEETKKVRKKEREEEERLRRLFVSRITSGAWGLRRRSDFGKTGGNQVKLSVVASLTIGGNMWAGNQS
jgi:hypothetical protein